MKALVLPAFKPWVGARYETEGLDGVRLLILGEAQYAERVALTEPVRGSESDEDANSTRECVKKLGIAGPEKGRPFWTKVAKLVLEIGAGESLSSLQREKFWHRVAFYNYVQWWMPVGRQRPRDDMWAEARTPFLQVAKELSPDLILVLGIELSRQLPKVESAVVVIKHPASVGFSYGLWIGPVRQAIEGARSTSAHSVDPVSFTGN